MRRSPSSSYDSLADAGAVAMRSDTLVEARGLGFVAGGYRLDVELLDDGRVVLGQLDPPAPAQVSLETQDGATTASADDLGRFRFAGRPRPPAAAGHHHLGAWSCSPRGSPGDDRALSARHGAATPRGADAHEGQRHGILGVPRRRLGERHARR